MWKLLEPIALSPDYIPSPDFLELKETFLPQKSEDMMKEDRKEEEGAIVEKECKLDCSENKTVEDKKRLN